MNVSIPRHTVIQYLRNKKGVPYGVLVAVKNPDSRYRVGYSVCNRKDRFSKQRALEIAIGRAEVCSDLGPTPHDVAKNLGNFKDRCDKYYKV